ncbi:zf-CSL domain-containing protein [Rhizoctonia solani AG-1 IA]|uniref:Diphthamide biosynthesis protein 3 n=1 Tax=Thanatephorus cucumeris (strain AG1-IA) TaxID=983506 RepID=L8WRT0_THACA|nr:zf-CSL domain-containing protein [Rhizoctonia solani AG-1 IA]
MGISYYDEVEIEDMVWDEQKGVFHYPCPCGDRFEISRQQLANYEDIATCPSCSLIIRVIFDPTRSLTRMMVILQRKRRRIVAVTTVGMRTKSSRTQWRTLVLATMSQPLWPSSRQRAHNDSISLSCLTRSSM